MPFRAYQLIYNEYYRDQNLTEPIDFTLGSGTTIGGDQLMALMSLRRRAWEKDYFTSALPWLQRGPEVTVPVQGAGSSMDVVYERQSDSQKWVDSSGREFENGHAYDITMARANDPNSALMIAVNGGTSAVPRWRSYAYFCVGSIANILD